MGKILFTNNSKWHSRLDKYFKEQGFQENGNCINAFFLTTYRKLNVSTFNFYEEEQGFIACSGTLIFRDLTGKEALVEMFSELKRKSIHEVRRETLGTYVVIYKMDKEVRVFIDETGTYAFYYCIQEDNKYLLTNTFYHIQKCTHRKLNKYAFLEQMLESCILNQETYFEGIYRILGDDCIVIDIDKERLTVEKIEKNYYFLEKKDFESVVNKLETTLRACAERKKKIGEVLHIFATGGVDSRIALATNMAAQIPTVICNWQGCPKDMNTKMEDYDIAKQIAEKLELECICYDVAFDNQESIQNIDETMIDRYGDYCRIYGSNKKWFEIFEKNGIKNTDFGYFGETLKGWEVLDNLSQDYISIEEYSQIYMQRRGYELKDGEYQRYITDKLRTIAIDNQLDIKRLSKEDCMKLYYVYRIHADTVIDNFANMFGYSFSLFAQKEISDYIEQVPYRYKEKFKLNLELTKRLCADLLDVEYFTHCRYVSLDKKQMVLQERWKYKLTKFIRFGLLGNKLGERIIARTRVVNKSFTNEYVKQIKATGVLEKVNVDITENTFGYLPTYALILFYCKIVQFSSGNGLKDDK